jgi:hypothetical protein
LLAFSEIDLPLELDKERMASLRDFHAKRPAQGMVSSCF